MNSRHSDRIAGAITARQRGRSRLRTATLVAGAAGVASAGTVALTLPAASHATAASDSRSGSSQGSSSMSRGSSSQGTGGPVSGTPAGQGQDAGSAHAVSGGS